jgi:hypothetical protein
MEDGVHLNWKDKSLNLPATVCIQPFYIALYTHTTSQQLKTSQKPDGLFKRERKGRRRSQVNSELY